MAEKPSSSRTYTTDDVVSMIEKGSFSEMDSSSRSDEDQDYDLSDPDAMADVLQKALVLDGPEEEAMEVCSPADEERDREMTQDHTSDPTDCDRMSRNDNSSSDSDTCSSEYRPR